MYTYSQWNALKHKPFVMERNRMIAVSIIMGLCLLISIL